MPGGANFKLNRNPHVTPEVKQDDEGLYVRIGDRRFRPGAVEGYDHRFDMRKGGLSAGDRVFTTEKGHKGPETGFRNDDNIRKMSTPQGAVYWHAEGEDRTRGLREHQDSAVFNREGVRQPFVERDEHGLKVRAAHYAEKQESGMEMIRPGQLDTYRIPAKDEGRFKEGEPVNTLYGSTFFGKKGSALEIVSQSGEKAKLKHENAPPLMTRALDQAKMNALSMASGFGR